MSDNETDLDTPQAEAGGELETQQTPDSVDLDDLSAPQAENGTDVEATSVPEPDMEDSEEVHTGQELEAVFDVPVNVQAVLGKSHLEVNQLLKLAPGAVIELDRKVGEAIDIYVNDRLVARGEVVMVEENLGVTMTEIIKAPRNK